MRDFNLPDGYRTVLTKSKTKGTMGQNEYWYYDVFDPDGNPAGTIEEWHCVALRGLSTDEGFVWYDVQGNKVAEG